jgi:hypothetical protein
MIEEVEGCKYVGESNVDYVRPRIDVAIAGAQKSGTTSLKEYLSRHSEITTHDHKEFGFLTRDDIYKIGYDNIFDEYFEGGSNGVVLAKSVSVMYIHNSMLKLYNHNDECNIIVIIRNPIERAYSAYWYMRNAGWEAANSFEKALKLEEERLSIRGELARHCGYVDRGLYGEQIRSLYDLFGRDSVIVLKFDNIKNDANAVCNKVFDFIGLDVEYIGAEKVHNPSGRAANEYVQRIIRRLERSRVAEVGRYVSRKVFGWTNPGKMLRWVEKLNGRDFTPPPMDDQLRRKLANRFRPDILRTEKLTGLDLSNWMVE